MTATALPPSTDFTGAAVTESDFKTALTDLRDYLSGLFGSDGEVATALAALGALGAATSAKSGAYTVTTADRGKAILCSGTWTLSLPAAATAADGFAFVAANTGTGVITLDGNGSELVDGETTIAMAPGASFALVCDGSAWRSVGRQSGGVLQTQYDDYTSAGTFTTTLPWDTSIPGPSEGTELLSVLITPKNAASRIVIDVSVLTYNLGNITSHAVLYKDGTPVRSSCPYAEGGNTWTAHEFRHTESAGSTSARTYTVRVGNNLGTSSWQVNNTQVGGAATGLIKPQMTVMEVL